MAICRRGRIRAIETQLTTWVPFTPLALKPSMAYPGPNATIFGPNVYIFDPSMPVAVIQDTVTAIFKKMESNEFGADRYALLFKPGTYNIIFDVGFYTQVAGLGRNPDDTLINGGANVPAYWMPHRNATCNFWRTFENFAINASSATNNTTTIAVSQAAPIRRMHVRSSGGLWLFQVDPNTGAGVGLLGVSWPTQWSTMSCFPARSNNGYRGTISDSNPPSQDNFPTNPYTILERTPVIREKPYLYITAQDQYQVFVPSLQENTRGPSWINGNETPGKSILIDDFLIAKPADASAASINTALDSGRHILFTPGIYKIDDALRVTKAGTIILGLGQPSLIPITGRPAISVADVEGVTIAGLIIDAGEVNSPTLVEVGPQDSCANHAANPTFLYDLTVRTAGHCKNDAGIVINSHNVVGDQLWLWRADHGDGAGWNSNPTENGVVVHGNNVTIYGLFNEHHKEYQTLWTGNTAAEYTFINRRSLTIRQTKSLGCVGRLMDAVTSHEAWGLGIYSYFRDSPTKLENAIEVPESPGVKLHHLTTVWLTGTPGSEISHIVNGMGGRVYANTPESAMRQTWKEYPSAQ
ncbi:hypothetical protein RRF57_003612 [Xylaria bambusicola]|uniref:Uncharacterized protein n=1 Tax=Xylaria bambusicola TaxID=326684 RepID=A0AAN7UGR7_9PEZI